MYDISVLRSPAVVMFFRITLFIAFYTLQKYVAYNTALHLCHASVYRWRHIVLPHLADFCSQTVAKVGRLKSGKAIDSPAVPLPSPLPSNPPRPAATPYLDVSRGTACGGGVPLHRYCW